MFQPLRHRPGLALLAVFTVSGLLHELVINLSLLHVTGRWLIGPMMVYFLLQPLGIFMERTCRRRSRWRRVYLWAVVFMPAPLVLNEGLLRVLHLWPD